MKFIFIFLILPSLSYAVAPKRVYSEEEFIKKVNEEVKKKVDVIKNKSVSIHFQQENLTFSLYFHSDDSLGIC